MVQFIRTWVTVIVVLIILNLTYAVFSPIVHNILNDLVLQFLYSSQTASIAAGHDSDFYFASLNTARSMIVGFFDLFAYIMSAVVLVWGILQSLRREESDYYV